MLWPPSAWELTDGWYEVLVEVQGQPPTRVVGERLSGALSHALRALGIDDRL